MPENLGRRASQRRREIAIKKNASVRPFYRCVSPMERAVDKRTNASGLHIKGGKKKKTPKWLRNISFKRRTMNSS